MSPTVTPCMAIKTDGTRCPWDSHVVLFAAGTRFNGHDTHPGEMLLYCFTHGEQLLDAIRDLRQHRPTTLPAWIKTGHNQLPRITPDERGWLNPQENRTRPRSENAGIWQGQRPIRRHHERAPKAGS